MKQSEYLKELEISLESRLSPEEVKDILTDYESFFAAGREEGKSDDSISEELGSPAYLARTLAEEHAAQSNKEPVNGSGNRSGMSAVPAANPGRRLCAYLIDSVISVLPALILSLAYMGAVNLPFLLFWFTPSPVAGAVVFASYSAYTVDLSEKGVSMYTEDLNRDEISTYVYRKGLDGEWTSSKPPKAVTFLAIFSLAFYLLYSFSCTILLKGQTIGKKLMRIKVRRTSVKQVPSGVIFIREFLGKILLNSIPIVPFVSLFTILLTKDHRALHDMLADTVVSDV